MAMLRDSPRSIWDVSRGLETDGGDGSSSSMMPPSTGMGMEVSKALNFAEGQNDGETAAQVMVSRVEAGDHHGTGHFRMGGDGGPPDKPAKRDADAVTSQGTVQAGIIV